VGTVDGVGGSEFTEENEAESSGNEVGQLVLAVERMKKQLARDREKIEHQVEELLDANAELRSAKEQLVLTEKLATVGTLAAGIAHEIGNPLAVLQGYGELLNDADLPDEKRVEYARAVEVAVGKVSTIIRDLLEFARPVDQSDDTCDVTQATRRAINLVAHQPSFRSIEIRFEASPEGLVAKINGGRLEQVLLNLLLNASHASPKGATVEVRIGEQASGIVLEVTDGGEGIPAGIQSKIFDPFFTTKEPGSGTGLGLSICHNIITGFDGTISFESREGQGTTFRIELPRAEPESTV
jgi:signal transduction histidine kinase